MLGIVAAQPEVTGAEDAQVAAGLRFHAGPAGGLWLFPQGDGVGAPMRTNGSGLARWLMPARRALSGTRVPRDAEHTFSES